MKLYGTARSRASRSLIALEELGLEYEHVPLFSSGDTPADRALLERLNPNSHVPVLEDDGLLLWESMAINLYLAESYGGPKWNGDPRERALILQWSFWAQTEMDRADWNAARRSGDEEAIRAVRKEKVATLERMDRALSTQPYLLGSEFSFADLNVAATLSQPNEGGKVDWQRIDPSEVGLDHLGRWLRNCTERPSWKHVGTLP